jgi:predicted MFS family arabinose efflux permease
MQNSEAQNKTRTAYIATRVLDTPFWAIYNMIPFILYKDLHASPWQLAFVIALKPIVSLLSTYLNSALKTKQSELPRHIVSARIISYLPFLFIPWIHSTWFLMFAFGFYMMVAVGLVPSWMELLKLNVPATSREKLFSYTQAFGYIGGGLLPFLFGWILDSYFEAWRVLFPVTALTALLASLFQKQMLVPSETAEVPPPSKTSRVVKPWKEALALLKRRKDFAQFQIGFLMLGTALMIMQPALPIYFVDQLHLSYMEMSVALTFCKGLGFAAATPFFSKWMHKMGIFSLTSLIAMIGLLFPFCLLIASFNLYWLYIGYVVYGVMQSGNELIWNMSGPYFAKKENSSDYTSINVISTGIRGAFVPALGGFLAASIGFPFVMGVSALLCLSATLSLRWFAKKASSLETPGFSSQS